MQSPTGVPPNWPLTVAERTAPGERVAVVADNSLAYAQCYYAVPRAGRVLTLVNQRLDPGEFDEAVLCGLP